MDTGRCGGATAPPDGARVSRPGAAGARCRSVYRAQKGVDLLCWKPLMRAIEREMSIMSGRHPPRPHHITSTLYQLLSDAETHGLAVQAFEAVHTNGGTAREKQRPLVRNSSQSHAGWFTLQD